MNFIKDLAFKKYCAIMKLGDQKMLLNLRSQLNSRKQWSLIPGMPLFSCAFGHVSEKVTAFKS